VQFLHRVRVIEHLASGLRLAKRLVSGGLVEKIAIMGREAEAQEHRGV
jgi:hypothetical protein